LSTTGFVTTLVYATYLSEEDAALKASMDKIPYLNYLTDPIKKSLSTAKIIISKPFTILEMLFPNQSSKAPQRSPPMITVQEPSKGDDANVVTSEEKQAAFSEDVSVGVDDASVDIPDTAPESDAVESIGINESIPMMPTLPVDEVASPYVESVPTEELQTKREEPQPSSNESSLDLPPRQLKEIPLVPSEVASKGVESLILKQAIADSARDLIALRRDLEMTMLRDLYLLDEKTLRLRIKHVVAELFDRLAWEDLRLSQSLKGVQAELTEKFSVLMSTQRAELEFELKKLLFAQEMDISSQRDASIRELEEKSRKQLNDTIQSQAEGFNATLRQELSEQANKIQSELQAQFSNTIALIRKDHVEELLSLQPKVQQVASELNEISNVLSENTDAVEKAASIHAASAAVLGLELSLVSSIAIKKHVSSLKSICRGDELVDAVLTSLPDSVLASGALSLSELQVRFNVMRDEVRKDALAPEAAPTIIGQFIGAVLATISIAPSGYVRGPGTEEALARAFYQLERGRLVETLRELDAVQGYGQVLMRDWRKLALDRVAVDQSVKVLKANALLRHFANKA